jgi:hypothetical protein
MAAGDLITAPYQLEWRGVLWGQPGTNVNVENFDGWLDRPAMRGENAPRPNRHGSMPGRKRIGERVIEADLSVLDPDGGTTLTAMLAATAVAEDPVEEALVAWFGTAAPELVWARLERASVPTGHAWSVGDEHLVAQWVATDPRRYSVTEHSTTIGLPSGATGGLSFPLTFPLSFGSATSTSQATATNAGKAATWPTFDITGPITGPAIVNQDTGQQLLFDPTFTVEAGQTLTVDTAAQSVTLSGVPRGDRLRIRQWFPLNPGANHILFASAGAYDPAASLTVKFRDAWL